MSRHLLLMLCLASCGDSDAPIDAGLDGAASRDAASSDAASSDAGDVGLDAPGGIHGRVTYEDRPQDAAGFTGEIVVRPAPFVRVVLLDEEDALIEETRANEDGRFAFVAEEGVSVRALSDASFGDHRVQVGNRARRPSLYALEAAVTGGELALLAEADAEGGAFNIAAVTVEAFAFYAPFVGTAADPVVFLWERGEPFDCGSCYGGNVVSVGGGFDDTDEYDDVILLHELGHYFVEHYSADDSSGGPHRDLQVDPVLAYGEGIAYAFAQIIRGEPFVIDTFATDVRSIDVEAMTLGGVELADFRGTTNGRATGDLREEIVNGIVWDAYDEASPSEPFDRVAIGVDGLMSIFVGHFGGGARTNVGAPGIDVADFLQALVCVTDVPPEDAQALADDRGFPWSPSGC